MGAVVTPSDKVHPQLAHMRKMGGTMTKAEPGIYDNVADENLVREYDDGPDWPVNNRTKEQAYRRGFVESARRIVDEWAHPPGPAPEPKPVPLSELIEQQVFDPFAEAEAAWQLRRRVRERFAVYGRGDAGRKTYHLGYQPDHAVAAARLRGRHHAMVFVTELWEHLDTSDLDIFDPRLLCPWLRAVERWADAPIKPKVITPPPRLLDVVPTEEDPDGSLRTVRSMDDGPAMEIQSGPRSPCESHSGPGLSLSPNESESGHTGNVASMTPPVRRLQLTRADQIEVRPPDWLLRGMLERDTFALVFGDPGCGKSFLAIDWACRIATGTPWRDHAVKAGPVVYIAGEGQNGFGRRIRAWQQHNDVSLDEKPLYLSPAVAMPDPADLVALVTAIDTGVAAVGGMPAMIVLDTLARNFGSGDESSTQDMTRFVASCDVIRKRYGCTVLVVHHTGHADKSRARGAMALKAALDAEYRLEQTAKHEGLLTATKMKDAEEPDPMGLSLVTVELAGLVDDYGNPVTSAAVEVATADIEAITAQAETARRRGKWQKHGLDIAKSLVEQSQTGWVDVFEWRSASGEAGMSRQTQLRVLETMAEYGEIVRHGDRIRLPNDD